MQYKFEYDKFGRTTANKVGNGTNWLTLSKLEYNNSGLMSKQTYGNGDYVDFSYDKFDRQTEKKYNGDSSQRVTYSYGKNGSVAQITDYFNNSNTRFVYDLAERVVSQREYSGTAKNGGELLSYTDFTYADKTNYLTGIKHFSPLGTQNIGYTYGVQKNGEMPDQIYSVNWNGNEKVKYTYDNLGRLTSKHTGSFDTGFTYEDVTIADDQRTTTLIKSVKTPTGTLTYEYDKLGNILSVTDGTYTTSYEYDSLNQLVRINDEKAGKTYTYSYTNGNISSQSEYPYTVGDGVLDVPLSTKTWEYNDNTWSDLLTNYNGTPITYDEIGNPLTIGEKSLTWTGRQLQSITDSDTEITYTYNGDGLRTSKTINGTKTEYYYNGSILAGQKSGNDTLVFMYDNNSDIFGFIYNDTEYYYIKNAQNDVIGIADADGNVLVKYFYDAWGKIILITDGNDNDITNLENDISHGIFDITTGESTPVLDENDNPVTEASMSVILARINPILYRSYYYDKETEWYYLNTRYYSPDMCRFVSADGYVQTGQGILDKNMFAYCENNPINRIDANGQFWGLVVAGVALAGVLALTLSGCSRTQPEPYNSANDAAKAFAKSTYGSSRYVRHEYGTEIYSRTINGKTTYNYNPPRSGKPHSVNIGNATPRGTKIVGYAHTHPNSNVFSSADISVAQELHIDAYVVGPNLELQHYNHVSGTTSSLGTITPIELTDSQKQQLVSEFQVSWDNHVAAGCDFQCSNMEWPAY